MNLKFKTGKVFDSAKMTLQEQKVIFGFVVGYPSRTTKLVTIVKVNKKNKSITLSTK